MDQHGYDMQFQIKMVLALMVIHNFIIASRGEDIVAMEPDRPSRINRLPPEEDEEGEDDCNEVDAATWRARIANEMWADYSAEQVRRRAQ